MISKTLRVSLVMVLLCSISFVNAQERKRGKRQNPEELFKSLDTKNTQYVYENKTSVKSKHISFSVF